MNDINYQEAVKKAIQPKFRGKKTIQCRTVPRYPDTAEREFRRVSIQYMRAVKAVINKHMPAIMEAYKMALRNDSRFDDGKGFDARIKREILAMAAELEKILMEFGLYEKLKRVSALSKKTTFKEWKRAVRASLGIDLYEDYYSGDIYEQLVQKWIADNVSYISSLPGQTLSKMEEILLDGYREGKLMRDIRNEIAEAYNVSAKDAQFLARDQISTLNAQITQMQQRDAGVKRYKWSSSKDERVRDCHRAFHGKIFSWDDPPEAWYKTKSKGIVYTGRKCHPGEDYACRCCAIPVFDWETIDLPATGGQQK